MSNDDRAELIRLYELTEGLISASVEQQASLAAMRRALESVSPEFAEAYRCAYEAECSSRTHDLRVAWLSAIHETIGRLKAKK